MAPHNVSVPAITARSPFTSICWKATGYLIIKFKGAPKFAYLVAQWVDAVRESHPGDGVRDQTQGGEVGPVGHPQSRHVSVDAVGDDAKEDLQYRSD